nr:transposase [Paenibacillus stellifer]
MSKNRRSVLHFNYKNLHLPTIRMYCKRCDAGFVWAYDFAGTKQQYSAFFRAATVEHALGSTAAHSARIQQAPASTVQYIHNEAVPKVSERIYEQVWNEAGEMSELVLGVDDFAIKKGHTYNTGIHNLKGETMLDLLPGRKLDDLRTYARGHPDFLMLQPKAVVMDLAQAYHTWISECFPNAIRIADPISCSRLCDRKRTGSTEIRAADIIPAGESPLES